MARHVRDLVLASSAAAFALVLGGCGGSAESESAPNDDVEDQDQDPPAFTSTMSETRELCDGSNDVRFVLAGGGGFVDEFYSFLAPLGDRFVIIDGSCNYAAGIANELGEIRTGQLDAEQAREIEAQLRYSELDTFDDIYDRGCFSEGYVTLLSDRDSTRGPVEPDAGIVVAAASERTTLRALRKQWREASFSAVPRIDTYALMQDGRSSGMTTFRLYLRDEPAPAVAEALATTFGR